MDILEQKVKDINDVEINIEGRVLAVDGDIIAYRTAAVCEDHFEGACESIIDTTLAEIARDTGISKMRIYLSGRDNFRNEVAVTKPYKGNRATMVRPQYLDHCKDYLVEKYNAIRMHGYEADDGVASDMVQNNAIHCGIDKDIQQIDGDHYNYVKKEWLHVTFEQSCLNLYRQILTGDTSDNIPGLPRVGAKTAEKVIQNANGALNDALEYYKEVCRDKLPEVDPTAYFLEQKALIEMKTEINLYDLFSCDIEVSDDGFEVYEEDHEHDGDHRSKTANNLKGGIHVRL